MCSIFVPGLQVMNLSIWLKFGLPGNTEMFFILFCSISKDVSSSLILCETNHPELCGREKALHFCQKQSIFVALKTATVQ